MVCLRLAHQIHSIDQTYDKIAQSLPKAIRIMSAMESNGGILYSLGIASARVWKVKPMALVEVDEFCLAGRRLAFLWPVKGKTIALWKRGSISSDDGHE